MDIGTFSVSGMWTSIFMSSKSDTIYGPFTHELLTKLVNP